MPNSHERSLLIGAVAGMRSMTAPAAVSLKGGLNGPLAFLGSPTFASVLNVAAAGEITADKMPFMPDRIDPPSLAFRAFSGGLCGAAVATAEDESPVTGALLGALAAVAASYAFFYLRHEITTRTGIPDAYVALAEDALAATAANYATS